jgi:hypothetical protein
MDSETRRLELAIRALDIKIKNHALEITRLSKKRQECYLILEKLTQKNKEARNADNTTI